MTSKISLLTTCTIALATALTNLTPLEARTMEGNNLNSNQEKISQTTYASNPTTNSGCFYLPGIGWVGNCPWLNND